jgi:hypothetical protein
LSSWQGKLAANILVFQIPTSQILAPNQSCPIHSSKIHMSTCNSASAMNKCAWNDVKSIFLALLQSRMAK